MDASFKSLPDSTTLHKQYPIENPKGWQSGIYPTSDKNIAEKIANKIDTSPIIQVTISKVNQKPLPTPPSVRAPVSKPLPKTPLPKLGGTAPKVEVEAQKTDDTGLGETIKVTKLKSTWQDIKTGWNNLPPIVKTGVKVAIIALAVITVIACVAGMVAASTTPAGPVVIGAMVCIIMIAMLASGATAGGVGLSMIPKANSQPAPETKKEETKPNNNASLSNTPLNNENKQSVDLALPNSESKLKGAEDELTNLKNLKGKLIEGNDHDAKRTQLDTDIKAKELDIANLSREVKKARDNEKPQSQDFDTILSKLKESKWSSESIFDEDSDTEDNFDELDLILTKAEETRSRRKSSESVSDSDDNFVDDSEASAEVYDAPTVQKMNEDSWESLEDQINELDPPGNSLDSQIEEIKLLQSQLADEKPDDWEVDMETFESELKSLEEKRVEAQTLREVLKGNQKFMNEDVNLNDL